MSVVKYDVSSQPVSIHVPITRLLSGEESSSGWTLQMLEIRINLYVHVLLFILNTEPQDSQSHINYTLLK